MTKKSSKIVFCNKTGKSLSKSVTYSHKIRIKNDQFKFRYPVYKDLGTETIPNFCG